MTDLCNSIELRFYDATGTQVSRTLPEARGVQISEELGAAGGASYHATLLAHSLSVSPDLLESGFCKAAIVLQAGQPATEVFAWEQQPTSGRLWGEAAERRASPSGVGLRNLFTYMPVLAESGTGWDENTEDARLFGWMSVQTSDWYSSSDWVTPASFGTLISNWWPKPVTAQWITADTSAAVGDIHLFRSTITLTSSRKVRFFWAADDYGTLYVDSKEVQRSNRPSHTNTVDLVLGAGTHTIAVMVKNTNSALLRLVMCVTYLTSAAKPSTIIRVTDTTHWKVHKVVSGVFPGWSAGAILRRLIVEAKALSQVPYGASLMTTDFTGLLDSAGASLGDLHTLSFPIGCPVSDVVSKLEELGYDIRVKPDFTVELFITQGSNVSATVWLQVDDNLISTDYQGLVAEATKIPVRSLQGWSIASDATGIADSTIGVRYGAIVSSSSANLAQGNKLASTLLKRKAHHRYVYTHRIRAVLGKVPWLDFKVGDTIKALDRHLNMVNQRVLSISAASPEDTPGPVLFDVEAEVGW